MCAGAVIPQAAWKRFQDKAAVRVDVGTPEECRFMGRMPGVFLIFWMYGTAMGRNTAFVSKVEKRLDRKSVILPLGRSGKRSTGAAEMLTVAGFENVFNVLDGFEGDLDSNMRRNHVNAWRYRNLPGFLDGMFAWLPVYGLFPVVCSSFFQPV
jgi:rhodanese-related sulfurtransferase